MCSVGRWCIVECSAITGVACRSNFPHSRVQESIPPGHFRPAPIPYSTTASFLTPSLGQCFTQSPLHSTAHPLGLCPQAVCGAIVVIMPAVCAHCGLGTATHGLTWNAGTLDPNGFQETPFHPSFLGNALTTKATASPCRGTSTQGLTRPAPRPSAGRRSPRRLAVDIQATHTFTPPFPCNDRITPLAAWGPYS